MKNYKNIVLGLVASVLLFSCNTNFTDEISIEENANTFPTTVAFTATSVSVDETGASTTITVELLGSALAADLTVDYTLTAVGLEEGVGYNFVGGSSLTIAAGEYSSSITVEPIDNETTADGGQSLTFVITSVSDASVSLGTETYAGRTVVLSIVDNDCAVPSIEGDFAVTTTGTNPAGCEGSENTVTITKVSDNADGTTTYLLSDVTGGLYLNCYGSADNPGQIVVDFTSVTMVDQADVVYGGDVFNGTGTIDSCGETLTISWSNGFGDAGTTVFPL